MKTTSLLKVLGLIAAVTTAASAKTPQQWPDCNCGPGTVNGLLAGYTFDNITPGMYNSIPPSYTSPFVNAGNISGPGLIKVASPTGLGNQWGCFGGFPANGGAASIGFKIEYTAAEMAHFCGLTFNAFSEGNEFIHGPTTFLVNVYSNDNLMWSSESVNLIPGFNNAISWDISNPDGDNSNGDGFNLNGNDFSWMQLTAGDTLSFQIVASGANTTQLGLDLDNIQVHACVVPEPGSALLLGSVGVLTLFRRRRR